MTEKIRFRVRWGRDSVTRKTRKHLLGYFTEDEIKKIDSMLNIANWFMDVKLFYTGRDRKGAKTRST